MINEIDDAKTDTALVPASTDIDVVLTESDKASMLELFGPMANREIHGFDGSPVQIYRQIARATSGEVLRGDDFKGMVLDLTGFFCHAVKIPDLRSGKVSDAIRTVLFTRDGKMYQFASIGIAQSLCRIVRVFGRTNWPNPMTFVVTESRTRQGFKVYNLVPTDD